MKRAPHPARLARHNSGGDWPFRTAVPGSNAVASAFCGWKHQERHGNQRTAQLYSKAGFAALHYTAKRMIYFFLLAFRLETVKPLVRLLAVKSVNVNLRILRRCHFWGTADGNSLQTLLF